MNYYVNTDIDLLEMIQFGATPVDRVLQADYLSFTPDIPDVKNKTIILNKHFKNSENRIRKLAKNNRIINRDKLINEFELVPYDTNKFEFINLSTKEVPWDSDKLELILLDDLIISNNTIKF